MILNQIENKLIQIQLLNSEISAIFLKPNEKTKLYVCD